MNASGKPLGAVTLWLVALMIFNGLASLYTQRPLSLVEPSGFLGYDFGDFFCAASSRLIGGQPYRDCAWFISPPPSMLHAMLLHPLGQTGAARVFFFINIASVAGASLFLLWRLGADRRMSVLALIAIALSGPFAFLLERGNTDGLVFVALVVTLCADRGLIAGAALAFAVAIKVYPLLLGPALLYRHRLPFVLGGAVVVVAMSLPVLDLWPSFAEPLLGRSNLIHVRDNVSFFALLYTLSALISDASWKPLLIGGTILYAALMVAALIMDWRLRERLDPSQRALLLASWTVPMVAFPPVVYAYSAIILFIPLLAAETSSHHAMARPGTQRMLVVGLCLALAPASALYSVTNNTLFQLLPSLGCAVLLAWFIQLRLDLLAAAKSG